MHRHELQHLRQRIHRGRQRQTRGGRRSPRLRNRRHRRRAPDLPNSQRTAHKTIRQRRQTTHRRQTSVNERVSETPLRLGHNPLNSGDSNHRFRLFLSRRTARPHTPATRHTAGSRNRTGNHTIPATDRRKILLDQLDLQRHARIPDITVLPLLVPVQMDQCRLRSRTPRPVAPAGHDDDRHVHPSHVHEIQMAPVAHRSHSLGLLILRLSSSSVPATSGNSSPSPTSRPPSPDWCSSTTGADGSEQARPHCS